MLAPPEGQEYSTAVILRIFEPIIFPTAISAWFFIAAPIVAASSGKLVMATTVRPIMSSLIPKRTATLIAAYTRSSAATRSSVKPRKVNSKPLFLDRVASSAISESSCFLEIDPPQRFF